MRSPVKRALPAALCAFALMASCTSHTPTPAASSPHPTTRKTTPAPTIAPSIAAPRAHVTNFATLQQAVSRATAYFTGSALIVAGGQLASGSTTDAIVSVDLANTNVTRSGKLARPSHDAGGATLAGHEYLFGGGSAKTIDTIQIFQPGQTAHIPQTTLPQPRSDLSVVSDGIDAWIVGGYDGTTLLPDVLHTRNGTTFDTIAKLPIPVRYAAVAYTGDAIYVFGGQTGNSGTEIDAVQRIDLATGRARVIRHMARPLAHASAVTTGTDVYILGGTTNGTQTARVLRFDLAANRFHSAGKLPVPLSDYALATAQGTAYIAGGETPGGTSSAVYRVFFS